MYCTHTHTHKSKCEAKLRQIASLGLQSTAGYMTPTLRLHVCAQVYASTCSLCVCVCVCVGVKKPGSLKFLTTVDKRIQLGFEITLIGNVANIKILDKILMSLNMYGMCVGSVKAVNIAANSS